MPEAMPEAEAVPEPEAEAEAVPEPEAEAEAAPEEKVQEIPEIPVNGPAPASSNPLFSGGKNHYIQNMKHNKTHRHHKRRNRHQTLRSVMK
jgi:hypothetical protein